MAVATGGNPRFRFDREDVVVVPPVAERVIAHGMDADQEERIRELEATQGYQRHPAVALERAKLARDEGLPQEVWWAFRRAKMEIKEGANVPATIAALVDANAAACLFNVVVALEWAADEEYLNQLEQAFREASKLLFDVTDGYMAIEQVVIGGPAWMQVADIQVLASNRLLPRSQVSGMLDETKYRPILLGRGLWSKREHKLHPWAEAFGALIHEWGHYALGLKDQYLETLTVEAFNESAGLVVPSLGLLSESIMAGDQQTEITGGAAPKPLSKRRKALQPHDPTKAKMTEWERLDKLFGFLEIGPNHIPQAEPPPLDPIPAFRVAPSAQDDAKVQTLNAGDLNLPGFQLKHCWVYTRKRVEGRELLIQQGVFDDDGKGSLALLGAKSGDEVILQLQDDAGHGQVVRGGLDEVLSGQVRPDWVEWPLVAVTCLETGVPVGHPVRLHVTTNADAGTTINMLPLGGRGYVDGLSDTEFRTTATDGAVVLSLGAADDAPEVIAHFSLGGSPNSGYPAHPNPIPSGSGEGNAMIFFHDPDIDLPGNDARPGYDGYRILTTTNYHVPAPGRVPRSYVFGVTTNQSLNKLPEDAKRLRPTLILAYDAANRPNPRVYRYVAGDWTPVPSTTFDDRSFVAAPLTIDTAEGLFAHPPRPEFYRLLEG